MFSIFYYHADICVQYDFLKVSCENVSELKSTSLFCFVKSHYYSTSICLSTDDTSQDPQKIFETSDILNLLCQITRTTLHEQSGSHSKIVKT